MYKRHITQDEILNSANRIVGYPGEINRELEVSFGEDTMTMAVYICSDFLYENVANRTDIIFVPQYEASPNHFMGRGSFISGGRENFVIGANNTTNGQRSFGFAILNSAIVASCVGSNIRHETYPNLDGTTGSINHSLIYDIAEESLLTLQLNLGNPVSTATTLNPTGRRPNVIYRNFVRL